MGLLARSSILAVLLAGALSSPAFAATSAVVPAGGGRAALAIAAGPSGVTARVCPGSGACDASGGAAIELPAEVAARAASAEVRAIALASGKHLGRVDVPTEGGGRYVVLLAAPAQGKDPVVVWKGMTGDAQGEHGEERTREVVEVPGDKGTSRVLVGQRREDVSICGRPALVSASEVDPATLALRRGASIQSISAADQARAVPLTAKVVEGDEKVAAAPVLRARVASSAVDKNMAALTDGDPETVWSEAKQGDGRGEFVAMSAAEVPITSLEIAVRPAKTKVDDGVAPRKLFVATTDALYAVTMPEDAWTKPGARYEVAFPAPVQTTCVAVVLDESFARAGTAAARTSIAEVTAHTAFDGVPLDGLVGALAGGADRAKSAASLLSRGGSTAIEAAIAGYDKLDDHGKELARNVIDGAPCSAKAGFYASRMIPRDDKGRPRAVGATDGEAIHARDHVRRCGREAASALAELVGKADDATKVEAARELAVLSPADAVPALLAAIPKAKEATRSDLRSALAIASRSARAEGAIAAELAADRFAALPEVARIDLLRAAGPALARVDGGARALHGLTTGDAPFRTRYLLLAPAADLAKTGDADALAFVRAALSHDADAHVRAHAAEVATDVEALRPELVRAVDDADPRVRKAALDALASPAGTIAAAAAARRLGSDPWTFVRVSAARALGAMPAGRAVDAPLAAALGDASPDVRGEALDALAAHHAVAQREAVRAIANKEEETLDVRARAILALGALCDTQSVDDLTKLARRLASPMGESDQRLGAAALTALGSIHPADLAKRLAPLGEKGVAPGVREAVRGALAGSGQCR